MERFILGFSTLFAFALGMLFDGGPADSSLSQVTQTNKAQIEYD